MGRDPIEAKNEATSTVKQSARTRSSSTEGATTTASSTPPMAPPSGVVVDDIIRELAALDDDAYLKVIIRDHGLEIVLFWKWYRGRFQGSYVAAAVPASSFTHGAEILTRKVREVWAGARVPVRDSRSDR